MGRTSPWFVSAVLLLAGCQTTGDKVQRTQEPPAQHAPVAAEAPPHSAQTPAALESACGSGDGEACVALGEAHARGAEVKKDRVRALMSFERGCELGRPLGCVLAASLYEEEGAWMDERRAADLYGRSCQMGSRYACTRLATFWLVGRGVQPDPVRALHLLNATCEDGDGVACGIVAAEFETGARVPKDVKRSAKFYARGCELGSAVACNQLGDMYENGRGVKRDYDRAYELYVKSCEGGAGIGCASIGYLYENGSGVPRDLSRAQEQYRAACKMESPEGCRLLAKQVEQRGAGARPEALQLYEKACTLGSDEACGEVRRLSRP